MISGLAAIAERLGVSPAFAPLVLAGVLTALVLFFQSIVGWFDDRNPERTIVRRKGA